MSNLFEKLVSSTGIYEGNIFDVKCDDVMLSNGNYAVREVVEHLDGVAIVALIEDKILMVKQYRYPAQDVLYELPAGKLEPEEDVLAAAKRELEEETGYIARKWESLGYIWTSPGFCTERLFLFKASNLEYKGEHPDDDELIDCLCIDKEQVLEMIHVGVINDAKSIAAIMRARIE